MLMDAVRDAESQLRMGWQGPEEWRRVAPPVASGRPHFSAERYPVLIGGSGRTVEVG